MNRVMLIGLSGLVAAVTLAACRRHVVIEPELVPSRNQADWTIESVPASARSAGGTGTAAPLVGEPSPTAPSPPQAPVASPPP